MANDASNEAATARDQGKGKALNGGVERGATASRVESSLTERLVKSATGLLRNTVGSSNGHAPGLIVSSTSLGSKAQSSGSSSVVTGWTETGAVRSMNGTSAGQQESFRTANNQSSNTEDFEHFLSSPSGSTRPYAPLEGLKNAYQADDNLAFQPTHFQKLVSSSRDASQQNVSAPTEVRDGAVVRDLRSDPASHSAFTDDTDDMSTNRFGANQTSSLVFPLDDGAEVRDLLSQATTETAFDDGVNDSSTAELSQNPIKLEQEIITAIKSDLPSPPTHKDVPTNHPLSLRPLLDVEKKSLPRDVQGYLQRLSVDPKRVAGMPREGREEWLADWEDVLSGYSDQVWGDILPIVHAATSELREVRNGSASLDPKTIARLNMIFGHVSQNGTPPSPGAGFAKRANKPNGG
ncbi:hypothetical protein FKW77_009118 [Venturia effusa]|uniref:Uncharacterized protein n=1 Tax=Venturia effusa TaxID=50376 RepID=A0A517KX61_9PEZI|nr:hypothetical protein FKW77_009118 [Venturia effusa]